MSIYTFRYYRLDSIDYGDHGLFSYPCFATRELALKYEAKELPKLHPWEVRDLVEIEVQEE